MHETYRSDSAGWPRGQRKPGDTIRGRTPTGISALNLQLRPAAHPGIASSVAARQTRLSVAVATETSLRRKGNEEVSPATFRSLKQAEKALNSRRDQVTKRSRSCYIPWRSSCYRLQY